MPQNDRNVQFELLEMNGVSQDQLQQIYFQIFSSRFADMLRDVRCNFLLHHQI